MSYLKFFQAIICALLCAFGNAQQVSQEQLDTLLGTLARQEKFMGVLQASRNGEKMYGAQQGFANLEAKIPATENTMYRVGSISKTFTATLVLKAVEEGKLSLSQTLETYFPTVPNAERITVAQLLNHHSGIPNFTNNPDFMQWHRETRSEQEMVDVISKAGSDFEPGSKAAYSNSNYVLLSYLLQSIYQQSFAELLEEKIIAPLGLIHTQFGDNTPKTHSYVYEVGWEEVPATDLSIAMGAGGIISTANDLARFIDGLFKGTLLSKSSLNLMLEQTDGYGMGIFKTQLFERDTYTHEGKIDGFNSVYYHFPNEKVTYVLLSNAENYDLGQVNQAVLAYSFGESFEVPDLPIHAVTQQDLDPYLGVYGSAESGLVITVTREGNQLLAQPEGQKIYAMDAVAQDRFKHYKSGVTLEFDPSKGSMVMKQGAQNIRFTKR